MKERKTRITLSWAKISFRQKTTWKMYSRSGLLQIQNFWLQMMHQFKNEHVFFSFFFPISTYFQSSQFELMMSALTGLQKTSSLTHATCTMAHKRCFGDAVESIYISACVNKCRKKFHHLYQHVYSYCHNKLHEEQNLHFRARKRNSMYFLK